MKKRFLEKNNNTKGMSLYRISFIRAICFIFFIFISTNIFAAPVTPQGKKLSTFLDRMDVTEKWVAGEYVNWVTGESVGQADNEFVTHCSAFVAATAKRLGVYILRPPAHATGLLANAQHYWLRKKGKQFGWFPIPNGISAQKAANQGFLVVATVANPNPHRPGHIAIVRPSTRSIDSLRAHGPEIIQAGAENFNAAPLNEGFSHHQRSLHHNEIRFYAHPTPFCQKKTYV